MSRKTMSDQESQEIEKYLTDIANEEILKSRAYFETGIEESLKKSRLNEESCGFKERYLGKLLEKQIKWIRSKNAQNHIKFKKYLTQGLRPTANLQTEKDYCKNEILEAIIIYSEDSKSILDNAAEKLETIIPKLPLEEYQKNTKDLLVNLKEFSREIEEGLKKELIGRNSTYQTYTGDSAMDEDEEQKVEKKKSEIHDKIDIFFKETQERVKKETQITQDYQVEKLLDLPNAKTIPQKELQEEFQEELGKLKQEAEKALEDYRDKESALLEAKDPLGAEAPFIQDPLSTAISGASSLSMDPLSSLGRYDNTVLANKAPTMRPHHPESAFPTVRTESETYWAEASSHYNSSARADETVVGIQTGVNSLMIAATILLVADAINGHKHVKEAASEIISTATDAASEIKSTAIDVASAAYKTYSALPETKKVAPAIGYAMRKTYTDLPTAKETPAKISSAARRAAHEAASKVATAYGALPATKKVSSVVKSAAQKTYDKAPTTKEAASTTLSATKETYGRLPTKKEVGSVVLSAAEAAYSNAPTTKQVLSGARYLAKAPFDPIGTFFDITSTIVERASRMSPEEKAEHEKELRDPVKIANKELKEYEIPESNKKTTIRFSEEGPEIKISQSKGTEYDDGQYIETPAEEDISPTAELRSSLKKVHSKKPTQPDEGIAASDSESERSPSPAPKSPNIARRLQPERSLSKS